MRRFSWMIWTALNAITGVLMRQRFDIDARGGDSGLEADWSDRATSQGIPAAMRSWKRKGMDSLLEPVEGAQLC